MTVAIAVVIVVIVFGMVVLLLFPDRPGGRISLGRLGEVSSVGAGVPLIVVGLAALVFLVVKAPGTTLKVGTSQPNQTPSVLGTAITRSPTVLPSPVGKPEITEFVIPTANSEANGIVGGPDGAVWFTESGANKIGRATTAGVS